MAGPHHPRGYLCGEASSSETVPNTGQLSQSNAALEFARSKPGAAKISAIGSALAGWAGKDPEAAKSWIAAKLEPTEQLMYEEGAPKGQTCC